MDNIKLNEEQKYLFRTILAAYSGMGHYSTLLHQVLDCPGYEKEITFYSNRVLAYDMIFENDLYMLTGLNAVDLGISTDSPQIIPALVADSLDLIQRANKIIDEIEG